MLKLVSNPISVFLRMSMRPFALKQSSFNAVEIVSLGIQLVASTSPSAESQDVSNPFLVRFLRAMHAGRLQ